MTAALTPEEVEARLRKTSLHYKTAHSWNAAEDFEVAADTIADLSHQLAEANAEIARLRSLLIYGVH